MSDGADATLGRRLWRVGGEVESRWSLAVVVSCSFSSFFGPVILPLLVAATESRSVPLSRNFRCSARLSTRFRVRSSNSPLTRLVHAFSCGKSETTSSTVAMNLPPPPAPGELGAVFGERGL